MSWRRLLPSLSLLLWGCGGDGGTAPGPAAAVALSLPGGAPYVGDTVRVTARVTDAGGRVLAAPAITWASSDATIASVNATGLVTFLSAGSATIRATVGSATGTVAVSATVGIPASIVFVPDTASVFLPSGTATLRPVVRDAGGRVLNNQPLFWRSRAPRLATVDLDGKVTAVAAGEAAMEATTQGITGTARVTVRARETATSPRVTGVAPSPLVPGATAVVTGSGFGATPAANTVLVDGIAATVTAATATQLTVRLPASGFACEGARPVAVQVTVGAESGTGSTTLRATTARTLAVGEAAVFSQAGESACTAWAAGARYLLAVANTGRGAGAVVASFTLRGATVAATAAVTGAAAGLRAEPAASPVGRALPASLPALATSPARVAPGRDPMAAAHLSFLEEQIAFLRRTGLSRSARPAAGVGTRGDGAAPLPGPSLAFTTPGALSTLRMPSVDSGALCRDFIPITVRTAWVGTFSTIVEDTASRLGARIATPGQLDSLYRRFGEEYEAISHPALVQRMGDPLAMDRRLRNRGRIIMVFSPLVNGFRAGGIEAFVPACDVFPQADQPSSNEGALFYGRVPLGQGDGRAALSAADWNRTMRATVAHEVKHVISFAERMARGQNFEESWMEEGLARHAEEWFGRGVYGNTWKGNAGYAQTLFCEVNWQNAATPACLGRPYVMTRHFSQLNTALLGNELYSPLAVVGSGDGTWYSTTWALTRWLADQQGDEGAFLRALVQAPETGTANLEARAGRSWEQLLPEYALALAVAGRTTPVAVTAALRFPSWDLRDQFQRLCQDFGACTGGAGNGGPFIRPYPLTPRAIPFGVSSTDVGAVNPGAFALFELGGAATTSQLIELTGPGGGPPPASLRLAVIRVE